MTTSPMVVRLANAVHEHLTFAERMLVARATSTQRERFVRLLLVYAGVEMTERDFAALVLCLARCALEVDA